MGRLFAHAGRAAFWVTLLALATVVGLVAVLNPGGLFRELRGPGAFYEVVPWLAMFVPAMALSLYGLAVIGIGVARFWRDLDRSLGAGFHLRAIASATADVLVLRQMRGGGPGCTYPDERPSHARVVYHQLVFYGFLLTFASTTMAAFTQEILGILPPYPVLSPIVLSGTVGGVLQVLGCTGLLALKLRATTVPASPPMRRLDVAFLALLLLVNLTGLVLLLLRETAAMGMLLAIHLGAVAGLFLTMPYGKFVHAGYRYAALVRNRREERLEEAAHG
jgi:citrate/tricarballylate utilization protein